MAAKKASAPTGRVRKRATNIRIAPLESEYLKLGAERDGNLPLTPFLRQVAMKRAEENLGYTFKQWQALKKKPTPVAAPVRKRVLNVRLAPAEGVYLEMGAEREVMGPLPLNTFLRTHALKRAEQSLGCTLSEFEARPTAEKAPRSRPQRARRG